jgi:hypothetical protein
MPALQNYRHELFAQAIVRGLNASDALAEAGYKRHGNNAVRLIQSDIIKGRIETLRAVAAYKFDVSREKVLERLWHCAEIAEEMKQMGPAVRAYELIGKEIGMFIDKSAHLNLNVNYGISDTPRLEEWSKQFAGGPTIEHEDGPTACEPVVSDS